jgi:hypothetical protein
MATEPGLRLGLKCWGSALHPVCGAKSIHIDVQVLQYERILPDEVDQSIVGFYRVRRDVDLLVVILTVVDEEELDLQ